jgi:acetyl esterase/lipase
MCDVSEGTGSGDLISNIIEVIIIMAFEVYQIKGQYVRVGIWPVDLFLTTSYRTHIPLALLLKANMTDVHHELRMVRYIPRIEFNSWTLRALRFLSGYIYMSPKPLDTIEREEMIISNSGGDPDVQVTITRPRKHSENMPAIFWIHGGGLVSGNRFMDAESTDRWSETHGAVVVSVEYRLAPEHPAPAAINDCFAAWKWMIDNAEMLKVDKTQVVIGGSSAGGGLAAATAQRVFDDGNQQPILQFLVYPMLDDRTVNASSAKQHYIWTTKSNCFGWASYLGCTPGSEQVPKYSVPARREDLRGLPPAWIGVGDQDLFFGENLAYADRLTAAGVEVVLDTVKGAFHASETLYPSAEPSKVFVGFQDAALMRAFGLRDQ